MDNADTAASASSADKDQALKDIAAFFRAGSHVQAVGNFFGWRFKADISCRPLFNSTWPTHLIAILEHIEECKNERAMVRKLCQDYELDSENVDKSVLEILHKVEKILDKNFDFLRAECKRHQEDTKVMHDQMEKTLEKLEQHALGAS